MKDHRSLSAALLLALAATACSERRVLETTVPPPPPLARPTKVAPPKAPTYRLDSPYATRRFALKGQLHAHSTNSDGLNSPGQMQKAYRRLGYDFVVLTDHDEAIAPPTTRRMIAITGVESEQACRHVGLIGMSTGAVKSGDIAADVQRGRAAGAFTIVHHPARIRESQKATCWTPEALGQFEGFDAVEIWNASGGATQSGYDDRVDALLAKGKHIWLTAGDDCHSLLNGSCALTFVSVNTDERTETAVVQALKAGNFYASTGARIESVGSAGMVITITLGQASTVEFITDGGRVAFRGSHVTGASYTVKPEDRYVRVRVRDDKTGKLAWTNPAYVIEE
jgi:hypothetical protein